MEIIKWVIKEMNVIQIENRIRDEGAVKISELLMVNSALLFLNLSRTKNKHRVKEAAKIVFVMNR